MNDDLISRQAAIEEFQTNGSMFVYGADGCNAIISRLKQLPPAPEKTGRWQITDAYPHNVYCSECHKRFAQTHWTVWEDGSLPRNYCPNCGAKMEAEDD